MIQREPSPELKPLELDQYRAMALIRTRYPERFGMIRRIHPICGNFFRVNFHDMDRGNVISESYFVSVCEREVVELN